MHKQLLQAGNLVEEMLKASEQTYCHRSFEPTSIKQNNSSLPGKMSLALYDRVKTGQAFGNKITACLWPHTFQSIRKTDRENYGTKRQKKRRKAGARRLTSF
jgi:hypothetical protein